MNTAAPYSRPVKSLDLVCLGRAAVDLYSPQIGCELEDVQRFDRYLGGSPANTAVGAARLGLRVGMISRVGDEQNGGFVRRSLEAEQVDVSQVSTDPQRLTALVFLAIRDPDSFPLLFYRQQCADMGLRREHIQSAYIGSAHTLLISGTHFSHPDTRDACLFAMQTGGASGTRIVLDIDYRPVLWGLTPPGLGAQRFVPSDAVTATLQQALPLCDLVVGTEEEIHIAGGTQDTVAALRAIRQQTEALIVMKRGPMGCVGFDGAIPDAIDQGLVADGFPVEVFNVLGAGDAFMAGLLSGWIRGESHAESMRWANACGAIVVSRHGCAPAMPSWVELQHFLHFGSSHHRLREDAHLEHIHRATTRPPLHGDLAIFAFDHRSQLEDLAASAGASTATIPRLKLLLMRGALAGHQTEKAWQLEHPLCHRQSMPHVGVLADGRYASSVLNQLSGTGVWIGRPVEKPGSRPLELDREDELGLSMYTWPGDHVAKCLVYLHADDPADLLKRQIQRLRDVHHECIRTRREFLIELIPPRDVPAAVDTLVRSLCRVYEAGIRPDWWKLPPLSRTEWQAVDAAVERADPHCRGVLLLGLDASEAQLWEGFCAASSFKLCRGFAVGRTLFAADAAAWFSGSLSDDALVAAVATRYRRLIRLWQFSRAGMPLQTCLESFETLESTS